MQYRHVYAQKYQNGQGIGRSPNRFNLEDRTFVLFPDLYLTVQENTFKAISNSLVFFVNPTGDHTCSVLDVAS